MNPIRKMWAGFTQKHPGVAQFLVFFILSNGVTVLQVVFMPLCRSLLSGGSLVDIGFQVGGIGHNLDGSRYYIFDYAAGSIAAGGGGGLAYFLSVQITMLIAQVINFFAQRSVTFKSNGSIAKAAAWYIIAYVIITIGAAALQGLYKAPVYNLLMHAWGLGGLGETLADFITMLINSAISFWVFFPIFKVIFRTRQKQP